MVDFNTYTPPGVYVEDISQDIVVPLYSNVPENLLCIVAQAQGYQSVTENVAIYSVLGTPLRNNGVVSDVSPDLVVRTMTGALLTKGADYAIILGTSTTATIINRLPSAAGTISPGGIVDGGLVQVTYNFTSDNYYIPQRFSDYSTLAAVYGQSLAPVAGTGTPIVSALSLAAKVAFENGAGEIIALPVKHIGSNTVRADFAAAYAQLVTMHEVSVLVVIVPEVEGASGTTLTNYLTDLRVHVDSAASNGFGRIVFTGGSATFDELSTDFGEVATTIANKRVVAVYPTRYNIYNSQTAEVIEVGGGYAAAALGGRVVLNSVEKSLTREVVHSFLSVPATVQQKMTLAYKNSLSSKGVCVIETDRLNRLVVRHAVTTDMHALTTREISLVRIADVLNQNIQVGLDNSGLIGEPITEEMPIRVKGALVGLLERAIADDVIISYINVLVRQQTTPNGDPSIIECQFAYKPAVPLNYIVVKFSLDLTSGVVETTP